MCHIFVRLFSINCQPNSKWAIFKTLKPCACNLFWTTAFKAPRSTSLGCWGSVFSWMLQRCVGHNYIFYKIFIVNVFYQYLFLNVVDAKLTNWNCHMYWQPLLTDSHSTIGVLWRGEGSLGLRVHHTLPAGLAMKRPMPWQNKAAGELLMVQQKFFGMLGAVLSRTHIGYSQRGSETYYTEA